MPEPANMKHFDAIMECPLQKLRKTLTAAFGKGHFNPEEAKQFLNQFSAIIKTDFPELEKSFKTEKKHIEEVIATDKMVAMPDLGHPMLQLAWASALAVEMSSSKGKAHGVIRKRLESHPMVETYRRLFALELQNSVPASNHIIPGRIDIDLRPAIVNEKSRIGDWEGDTIAGANHQSALLSHVERVSKFTRLHKLFAATAHNATSATVQDLRGDKDKVLTITYDNGKEFAGHQRIAEILNARVFFAKPYHAWERGLNEHTNGLVRQYFPKGTDFNSVSDEDIALVEKKLNNRPRKVLGYKTPSEVFKPAAANS